MEAAEALRIVRALAEGADPETGEMFPEDSPYQRPEVIRTLFAAAADEELKKEFDGGAKVPNMVKRHGRTHEAIAARLVRLGKIPSRDAAPRERSEA